MRRAVLVVALVVGCKAKREEPREKPPVAEPVAAAVPSPDAAAPVEPASSATLELPDVVGLPVFLSGFRAHAKKVDLATALSRLEIDATKRDADDPILRVMDRSQRIYKTPVPGVFAQLTFIDGRFTSAMLATAEPAVLESATKAWGEGQRTRDRMAEILAATGSNLKSVEWTSLSTGWTAALTSYEAPVRSDDPYANYPLYRMKSYGVLRFSIADPVVASRPVQAERDPAAALEAPGELPNAKVFPFLQSLLGMPLDKATAKIGGRIETADAADGDVEALENKQGTGYIEVSWSDAPWEVTLTVGKDGTVSSVYAEGALSEDKRVDLFTAMRASFGAPQPVVNEEGRLVVAFPKMGKRLDIGDYERQFEITLTR